MASPFKKLPVEALHNIKAFYSDKYTPHPMADAIRALDFEYELESYETVDRSFLSERVPRNDFGGYFHPPNLKVTGEINRQYILSDFKEPDRYVEDSNIASGFLMGRVRSND